MAGSGAVGAALLTVVTAAAGLSTMSLVHAGDTPADPTVQVGAVLDGTQTERRWLNEALDTIVAVLERG